MKMKKGFTNKLFYIPIIVLLLILSVQSLSIASGSNFSVSIPMQLPINMDGEGNVTTANNSFIVNNSIAPIKITNVQVNTLNGWNISNYNGDYTSEKVGSKKLGLILNGDLVGLNGTVNLTPSNWGTVDINSNLNIDYDARIPAQIDNIINQQVANVVFTVDWANYAPISHTVTFRTSTGGTISGGSPQVKNNVISGTTIPFPTPTALLTHFFTKWVDVSNGQTITPNTPIVKNITIEARFQSKIITDAGGNVIDITSGTIINYTGSSKNPTIPSSVVIDGATYPVTEIGDGAYNNKGLTGVNITNGIVTIGSNAFSNNNIATLLIPNSVSFIGSEAFRYNKIHKNDITADNYSGAITIDVNAFANNHASGNQNIVGDIRYTRIAPNAMIMPNLLDLGLNLIEPLVLPPMIEEDNLGKSESDTLTVDDESNLIEELPTAEDVVEELNHETEIDELIKENEEDKLKEVKNNEKTNSEDKIDVEIDMISEEHEEDDGEEDIDVTIEGK